MINEIIDIKAISPKFTDESDLMTQLDLTLSISGRRKNRLIQESEISIFTVETKTPFPSSTPYPLEEWGPMEKIQQLIKLTVDIFPQIEKSLNLSINQKENEIIRVIDEKEEIEIKIS